MGRHKRRVRVFVCKVCGKRVLDYKMPKHFREAHGSGDRRPG